MAGTVNDSQAAQVGVKQTDQGNVGHNTSQDQQKQQKKESHTIWDAMRGVPCEEESCCVSAESTPTLNITQALAAAPLQTQRVALELCWYCLKSLSIEELNIPQVESEDLTLLSSGERLNYQRDPRPHFGVAHSSRSVSFPLWDSDRPREMKREEDEGVDSDGCCPHCYLGLARDTLRWHEAKCLLFDGLRNSLGNH